MDYIIISMGYTMNIEFGFDCLVAAAVVFWLLANELISILENIADIGVPMPAFLLRAVELVKEKNRICCKSRQKSLNRKSRNNRQ